MGWGLRVQTRLADLRVRLSAVAERGTLASPLSMSEVQIARAERGNVGGRRSIPGIRPVRWDGSSTG